MKVHDYFDDRIIIGYIWQIFGRTERGYDFLGDRFKFTGIDFALVTITHFTTKALQIYEQEPAHTKMSRLGAYGLRRIHWATSG